MFFKARPAYFMHLWLHLRKGGCWTGLPEVHTFHALKTFGASCNIKYDKDDPGLHVGKEKERFLPSKNSSNRSPQFSDVYRLNRSERCTAVNMTLFLSGKVSGLKFLMFSIFCCEQVGVGDHILLFFTFYKHHNFWELGGNFINMLMFISAGFQQKCITVIIIAAVCSIIIH